jgi:hypothetical protein
MRTRIEWEWERLDANTSRAKVIGGWMVRSEWATNKSGVALSSMFVADKDHCWNILQPAKEIPAPKVEVKA